MSGPTVFQRIGHLRAYCTAWRTTLRDRRSSFSAGTIQEVTSTNTWVWNGTTGLTGTPLTNPPLGVRQAWRMIAAAGGNSSAGFWWWFHERYLAWKGTTGTYQSGNGPASRFGHALRTTSSKSNHSFGGSALMIRGFLVRNKLVAAKSPARCTGQEAATLFNLWFRAHRRSFVGGERRAGSVVGILGDTWLLERDKLAAKLR